MKLYGATRKQDVSFHMIHKKCSSPIHYLRHCNTCDAEVPLEDIVHGYEYQKEKFVLLTDQELASVPIKSARSIDMVRFLDGEEIDPIYYDKTYYLEPAEGGERAYGLLREVMKSAKKAALAKITLRDREHVAVVRLTQNVITLHTLFYADEIIKTGELNIPGEIKLTSEELSLAKEILKRFVGHFDIENYHDEFRGALLELIQAKVAGKKVKVIHREEVAKVVNLMDALKKSLKEKEKKKAAG